MVEKAAGLLVMFLLLWLVEILCYKPKRVRLISSFLRDHQVDRPFRPAVLSYSGALRGLEPFWVLLLWVLFWGLIGGMATWGAISRTLEPDDASLAWLVVAAILTIAAIGFGVWWYRRGQEIPLPGVKELRFDVDKLTKLMAAGAVHEYPFDANLRFTPQVVEATGFLGAPVKFQLYLEVISPTEEFLVPAEFVGLGEFLARARHAGAKVEFAKDGPAWLAEQMQALPSWQPGYFDRPAIVAPVKVELSCQACGGAARYETGLKEYACHYCGSARLTPTATFKG
jgi:DNA-directed RNA polymerase subunit RPC12/RpoP